MMFTVKLMGESTPNVYYFSSKELVISVGRVETIEDVPNGWAVSTAEFTDEKPMIYLPSKTFGKSGIGDVMQIIKTDDDCIAINEEEFRGFIMVDGKTIDRI